MTEAREDERRFDAGILSGRGGGAYVEIPFDVAALYGTRGRVPVRATFDTVAVVAAGKKAR